MSKIFIEPGLNKDGNMGILMSPEVYDALITECMLVRETIFALYHGNDLRKALEHYPILLKVSGFELYRDKFKEKP